MNTNISIAVLIAILTITVLVLVDEVTYLYNIEEVER